MKYKLSKIEARLRSLFEGGAAFLFSTGRHSQDLATALLQVMHEGAEIDSNGVTVAPNLYTIWMHPARIKEYQEYQPLCDSLANILQECGIEAGFTFLSHPVVRVFESLDIEPDNFEIRSENSQASLPETVGVEVQSDVEAGVVIPPDAFLIVDGTLVYTLNQPVVNIGRRPDNDVVINDPRVSRVHAQLRALRGQYVIFDLGSSGGTFVNGQLVSQSVLRPGDVISLCGVPLIFGQETSGLGNTQSYSPTEVG